MKSDTLTMQDDFEPMHVAYCADCDVEIGLHASVRSLLSNNKGRIDLHIVTDQSQPVSKDFFLEEFETERSTIKFYNVNSTSFRTLSSLVGSRFPYSKLLIPELVDTPRVLYLDTDTIVDTDISELWRVPMADAPLCALNSYPVGNSIESSFLMACGLNENDKYFNTGVLLINTLAWKQSRLVERTLEFARTHPSELKTADQTVLNALFSRSTLEMSGRFNKHFWPTSNPRNYPRGQFILHFAGGLKPWDAFSSSVHSGYGIWSGYSNAKHISRLKRRSRLGEILHCARRSRYYARALQTIWIRKHNPIND